MTETLLILAALYVACGLAVLVAATRRSYRTHGLPSVGVVLFILFLWPRLGRVK